MRDIFSMGDRNLKNPLKIQISKIRYKVQNLKNTLHVKFVEFPLFGLMLMLMSTYSHIFTF